MENPNERPRVITRFYQSLDEETAATLTAEQKQAVEKAVLEISLSSRHRIDVRRSFPFLTRRYYFVFLFGRDLRRYPRHESALWRVTITLLLALAILICLSSVFIALYLIKSALGIDIFPNFHLGLWDWLMQHHR